MEIAAVASDLSIDRDDTVEIGLHRESTSAAVEKWMDIIAARL